MVDKSIRTEFDDGSISSRGHIIDGNMELI
jgi:hypothetical protein